MTLLAMLQLMRRSFANVRRMASHPTLPYCKFTNVVVVEVLKWRFQIIFPNSSDLTGHHDGSIRMWEWSHPQQITLFRSAGQYPK